MRRAGIRIALATDAMHADMVELTRWALASGRIQENQVDQFWQPHHVFHMATLAGAEAMGLSNDLGSLEVGKKADLVMFDFRQPHLTPLSNPIGSLVHAAQGRDVELVIVDGRVVVERGEPTCVDAASIRLDAAAAAKSLWRRPR
jgi:5-methylthioadenosine/S-adenosylhomocysteine deaminase